MSKSAISIWYKASPTFWQVVSFCSNLVPPTAASVCSLSPLNLPLTGIWTGEREKDRRVQISIWPSTWRERNLFLFVYKSRQKNGKGWLLRTMCAVITCHHQPPASLKNSKILPPALFNSKTSTAATDNAAPPKLFASNLKFRYFSSFFGRFPGLLLSPQSEMIHTVEEYYSP